MANMRGFVEPVTVFCSCRLADGLGRYFNWYFEQLLVLRVGKFRW